MEIYRHRQFSPWALAVSALPLAFAQMGSERKTRGALGGLGVALFLSQFSVMNTRVDDTAVSWNFGFGFPAGSVALKDVESATPTRTKLAEGFGIHWTPWRGWLWNVAIGTAVQITKRNGRSVTIGTDDPNGLYEAIRIRVAAASP